MRISKIYYILALSMLLTISLCFKAQHKKALKDTKQSSTSKVDSLQFSLDQYSQQMALLLACQKKYESERNEVQKQKEIIGNLKHDEEELCKYNDELINEMTNSISNEMAIDSLKNIINRNFDTQDKIDEDVRSQVEKMNGAEMQARKSTTEIANIKKQCNAILIKIHILITKLTEGQKLKVNGIMYSLFVANLDKHLIDLHLKDTSGKYYNSIGSLLKNMKHKEPLMVTNGGMFGPDNSPQGLYIEAGANKIFPLDETSPTTDGNFYLKPNGVFYIDSSNTAHVLKTETFSTKLKNKYKGIHLATQSGPMLVIDGKIHPLFKPGSSNTNIRSGVGIVNNKKIVFIISNDEVNFYNFALIFKDIFQCKNALYLDGAISLMYLHDKNKSEKGGYFGPMISVTKKK
jgi:uncharacterized protein YigE (DUF2233 family)